MAFPYSDPCKTSSPSCPHSKLLSLKFLSLYPFWWLRSIASSASSNDILSLISQFFSHFYPHFHTLPILQSIQKLVCIFYGLQNTSTENFKFLPLPLILFYALEPCLIFRFLPFPCLFLSPCHPLTTIKLLHRDLYCLTYLHWNFHVHTTSSCSGGIFNFSPFYPHFNHQPIIGSTSNFDILFYLIQSTSCQIFKSLALLMVVWHCLKVSDL